MRSARYLSVVSLWLAGCFDLDAPRPECFADDPCANGAACVQGQCGDAPKRSVSLDISRCADDAVCQAKWADATLCGVVQVGGQTAVGQLNTDDARLELVLPLGASTAQAAVFAVESDTCDASLTVDAACDAGCVVAWGFAAQDVPEGPIALTARCDDVRWPAAPVEICNSADDDCDGIADEEIGTIETCTEGTGACREEGALECVDGGPVCSAVAGLPNDEVLDDDVDNDCDGIIDEAPPACPPGTALACETACAMGTRQCSDAGVAGPCLGADGNALPEPADEICNGADDDCDGTIDEGFELGMVCNLGGPGCAAQGVLACDGDDATRCDGVIPDGLVERCDGLDGDCDGVADNGFDVGDGCVVGVGVCGRDGVKVCDDAGEMTVCAGEAGAPSVEVCNDLDDDCDGTTDEGFGVGDACMRGDDACAEAGVIICAVDETGVCDAPEPREPTDETCNGADDDCDGVVDEGLGLGDVCERGEGPCVEVGVIVCDANDAPMCNAADPDLFEPEVCDSVDNDCDDIVDEGFDFEGDLANCGACGQTCAVPNARNACVNRVCVADACADGFVDLNDDLAAGDAGDGCECVVLGVDVPDPDGVDDNCDGVDGEAAASIFVDPLAGNEGNPGTPGAPVATLTQGLALVDAQRRRVLLSVGVHPIIAPQEVPDGVHIHGGYGGTADSWRRVPRDEAVTTLQGPAIVLRYANLTVPTTLDRVDITTPDSDADVSTIAIVAANVDVHLTLSAVHIRVGRGGDGAAGSDGSAAPNAPQDATPGAGPNGGAAGLNADCVEATGGNGANVVDGAGQDAPGGAIGGLTGAAGEDGLPGMPGARGTDGTAGEGASAFGAIMNGRWRLTQGTNGTPGTPGFGGGGAGAGGMEVGPVGPFRLGGGGGGGAPGGCPGGAGQRGGSGGASIALMVRGGQVRAIDCAFFADAGGAGGVAGAGPVGAPGGVGADGELDNCGGACGAGARGGDGGGGGCGGPGGGGAGGPSIGVLGVGPAAPVRFEDRAGALAAPVIAISDPGAAGSGGAGCGVSGGDGALGVALPIGCCILAEDAMTCAALVPCDEAI